MKIGLDTFLAGRHIRPRQDDTTSERVMKTVEVPRGMFAIMFGATAVLLIAGCITLLSWLATGQPHPDWVTTRQQPPAPPSVTHKTRPNPIPPAGGDDLIPPTNLPVN